MSDAPVPASNAPAGGGSGNPGNPGNTGRVPAGYPKAAKDYCDAVLSAWRNGDLTRRAI